jgi:hypothetical protein
LEVLFCCNCRFLFVCRGYWYLVGGLDFLLPLVRCIYGSGEAEKLVKMTGSSGYSCCLCKQPMTVLQASLKKPSGSKSAKHSLEHQKRSPSSPLPRRHRIFIFPQPLGCLLCFLMAALKQLVVRCISLVPPSKARADH